MEVVKDWKPYRRSTEKDSVPLSLDQSTLNLKVHRSQKNVNGRRKSKFRMFFIKHRKLTEKGLEVLKEAKLL